MAEKVEIVKLEDTGGYIESLPGIDADLRVPAALWNRYDAARKKLAEVEAQIEIHGERPLVVTPDQETAMRAAARPGTWIVVRESAAPSPPPESPDAAPSEVAADSQVAPEASGSPQDQGPPKRPPLGPCASRSNLRHQPDRFAITEAASVYYPGRIRVDGICRCGLRIADVRCPHQKQVLNEAKQPACAWCRQVLVARAGMIDNRAADGSPDPKIPTLIPIGSAGDDPAVKTAFRVESGE